jgi:hypothetical protein
MLTLQIIQSTKIIKMDLCKIRMLKTILLGQNGAYQHLGKF